MLKTVTVKRERVASRSEPYVDQVAVRPYPLPRNYPHSRVVVEKVVKEATAAMVARI